MFTIVSVYFTSHRVSPYQYLISSNLNYQAKFLLRIIYNSDIWPIQILPPNYFSKKKYNFSSWKYERFNHGSDKVVSFCSILSYICFVFVLMELINGYMEQIGLRDSKIIV